MSVSMETREAEQVPKTRTAALTPRERQIVELIARGYTNQQIAATLNLSHQSIKNRLTAIYEKVQVRGRVKLAMFAVENGLD